MKVFRAFLFVLITLLAVVFIFELYARVFYYKRLQIYSKVVFAPDSVIGFRYLPNAKGLMLFPAYTQHFTINKYGFVGKDVSKEKKNGIYRIVVLGSSDECGLFTNGPLNYPSLLQTSLNKIGHKVEVVNLSIDGVDRSMRNIRMANGEALTYHPDLILLRNDFPLDDDIRTKYRSSYHGIEIKYAHPATLDSAKRYIDEHIQKKQFQHYVVDFCYAYRFLIRINFKYDIPLLRKIMENTYDSYVYWSKNLWWSLTMDKREYEPTIKFSEEESIKILKATKNKLDSNRVALILYNTYSSNEINHYNDIFKKNGLNYWALNVPENDDYSFGDVDGHTSQKGHIAIGKVLTKKMDIFLKGIQK